MSNRSGGLPPAGQTSQPTEPAWQMSQVQQTSTPPKSSRDKKTILIVVTVVVVLAVIAALLFLTYPFLDGVDGYLGITFSVGTDGSNWTLTVAGLIGETRLMPSEVCMTILDDGGSVKMPVSSIQLANLTLANWTTYRVAFLKVNPSSYLNAGDKISVDQASYPSGYHYQIQVASTNIASGTFR
jgi:hypothetical protein